MKRIIYIVISCLVLMPALLIAQINLGSTKSSKSDLAKEAEKVNKEFNETWDLYLRGQNAKVKSVCEKLIKDYPDYRAAYNRLGQILEREGKLEEAKKNYDQYLKLSEAVDSKDDIAIAQNNLGLLLSKMHKDDAALTNLQISLRIAKGLNNPLYMAIRYNNIGGIYLKQNDNTRAKENIDKSLEQYEKVSGVKENYAIALSNRGILYEQENDMNNALKYYRNGMNEAKKNSADYQTQSIALNNLAIYYLHTKEYDEAMKNFEESLSLEKKLSNQPFIASRYSSIGYTYYLRNKQGDLAKAQSNIDQAIQIDKKLERNRELAMDYVNMALILQQKKDQKGAIEILKKAEELQNKEADTFGLAITLMTKGNAYKEQKNYSEAIAAYSAGSDIYKDLLKQTNLTAQRKTTYKNQYAMLQSLMGDCGVEQRSFAEAYKYYEEGKTIKEEIQEYDGAAYCYWWMAFCKEMEKKKESYEISKDYYAKAKDYYSKNPSKNADQIKEVDKFLTMITKKIEVENELIAYQGELENTATEPVIKPEASSAIPTGTKTLTPTSEIEGTGDVVEPIEGTKSTKPTGTAGETEHVIDIEPTDTDIDAVGEKPNTKPVEVLDDPEDTPPSKDNENDDDSEKPKTDETKTDDETPSTDDEPKSDSEVTTDEPSTSEEGKKDDATPSETSAKEGSDSDKDSKSVSSPLDRKPDEPAFSDLSS